MQTLIKPWTCLHLHLIRKAGIALRSSTIVARKAAVKALRAKQRTWEQASQLQEGWTDEWSGEMRDQDTVEEMGKKQRDKKEDNRGALKHQAWYSTERSDVLGSEEKRNEQETVQVT